MTAVLGCDWPAYYPESLTLGNPQSSTGICTLWTPQPHFARRISAAKYAALGNLYSKEGINLMLRNLLANPRIRHLVVCGSNLSGTADTLRRFFTRGITADHQVFEDDFGLDANLPSEALDAIREGVSFYDLTGERNPDRLGQSIADLPPLPPYAEPHCYPREIPHFTTFPSEATGYAIRCNNIPTAWLSLMDAVLRFGVESPTSHIGPQRELLDVVVVLNSAGLDEGELPDWFPASRRLIAPYIQECLEQGHHDPEISYTYGDRLRAFRGVDQLAAMEKEIRSFAESRRAMAVLWDPQRDANHHLCPCIVTLHARLRLGVLHLTSYIRSSDVYKAWPLNIMVLRELQTRLGRSLGAEALGDLVTVLGSAHVYEDCWAPVGRLVEKHRPYLHMTTRSEHDPRGSFAIRLESPEIVVDHFAPAGHRLACFRGQTASELERDLQPFVSDVRHAMYLGRQLLQAEVALRLGTAYRQDTDLALSSAG